MSDRVVNLLSPTNSDSSSSTISINSRSSITIESPKQGGRQRDVIWSHFHDMGPAKTPAHQCEEIVICNPQARKDIIMKMRDMDNQSSPSTNKRRETEIQTTYKDSLRHKQYTIDRFTSRIIPLAEQQTIDRCLLRAIIMNARKKLAHEILTQEVVNVDNQNESLLVEAAHLTLNIDGWSDRCHRSLYEYNVITDNRKAIILSLIDISKSSHTAEYLVNRLEIVLARASISVNMISKIRAIVTDNPNTMQKMRQLFVSKPNNQHIIELRCFAHAVNLMTGDVIQHVYAKNIINKVTTITSFCNRSHAFKANLKEEAGRMKIKKETLDTIVITRWSSVAESLNSFILLRAPLEVLVVADKSIAPIKIISIINSRCFFKDVENLYKIMKPLAYAMKIIQSSSITLADCYLILSYLQLAANEFVAQTETRTFGRFVNKVINIRLKEFENDLYLSAYYLHPKYRGGGMLTDGRSAVYRYIAEYSKKIGNNLLMTKNVNGALQRFEIRSGPYSLNYTEDDTPSTWWSMINDNTHKNSLSNIALRLFSITPHSVMPERLFSILDWQHTKHRNRLSPFTLEAIAKIHTFYTNESHNIDEGVDTGYLEDALDSMNDSRAGVNVVDEGNNSSLDANDFIRYANENHQALCAKCDTEVVTEEQSIDDEEIIQQNKILNTQDKGFQQILIDLEFIDASQLLFTEDGEMMEDEEIEKIPSEDYDVEEVLTETIGI
ncbi:unnamed protein product [Rotaria magnacalcarata]|uniref:DUF659 domain-containing protein n=2 Tax=Rotaria magnacalcarata TaxID=392030 RepID=A0A816W6M1_9BILA|nr:unnamed protein product [Rotaria magnacalcarata]